MPRLKPRFNEWVNDYWMCDYGRSTFERWQEAERLVTPKVRRANGSSELVATTWQKAVRRVLDALGNASDPEATAFVASADVSTEEAFLLARLAQAVGSPNRRVVVESGPQRSIPTVHGVVSGSDEGPNRRGALLAGLEASRTDEMLAALRLDDPDSDGLELLFLLDPDLGGRESEPAFLEAVRRADTLVVASWRDDPLTEVADVLLPLATTAEKEGTFVNVRGRLQRFEPAFPPAGQARPGVDLLIDLLVGLEIGWRARDVEAVFAQLAKENRLLAGLSLPDLPAAGVDLEAERQEGQREESGPAESERGEVE